MVRRPRRGRVPARSMASSTMAPAYVVAVGEGDEDDVLPAGGWGGVADDAGDAAVAGRQAAEVGRGDGDGEIRQRGRHAARWSPSRSMKASQRGELSDVDELVEACGPGRCRRGRRRWWGCRRVHQRPPSVP
jgi:hypothetical protein